MAEEVGADGARERGRSSAVERGVDDVRGHERGDAGAGRAREGHEVDGGERAARTVDARQDEMGIPCARPVTREVLATGHDARVLEPAREREPEASDAHRLLPESPIADHAIAGVRADVEHGREGEIDADGAQLAPHRPPDRLGEPDVSVGA